MSWWGTLANIGLTAAAPFTGGATLAAIPAVSGIDAAESASGAPASGGSGINWQQILRYGAPIAAGAAGGIVGERNFNTTIDQQQQQLAAQRMGQEQSLAVQQSALDPNRGVMSQMKNAGRLERAAAAPAVYGPQPGSRYAKAAAPRQGLSDSYKIALELARQGVLAGRNQVPNQLDPSHWGDNGGISYSWGN